MFPTVPTRNGLASLVFRLRGTSVTFSSKFPIRMQSPGRETLPAYRYLVHVGSVGAPHIAKEQLVSLIQDFDVIIRYSVRAELDIVRVVAPNRDPKRVLEIEAMDLTIAG